MLEAMWGRAGGWEGWVEPMAGFGLHSLAESRLARGTTDLQFQARHMDLENSQNSLDGCT